ncbi:MAG: ethylbenzene dehydrogenase-related protein [Candidatus Eisenbacteria bacterium]
MRREQLFAWVALVLALGLVTGCGKKGPPISTEVVAVKVAKLPTNADDPVWKNAPVCNVALIPQDMVEPRLLRASTPSVQVQAASDDHRLAFHLTWSDSTRDDTPGAARFSDACAVQLPVDVAADLPAPQMGESGRPVHITYWSSSWQAVADGRKEDIRSLYPNATPDHYPFEAASLDPTSAEGRQMALRYAPARALGNFMAGDGEHSVQDLMAEGPGSLTGVTDGGSDGRGRRLAQGWEVVITRPAPDALSATRRAQVAFAVWQGHGQEVGARKMRSAWTPLSLGPASGGAK